MTSLKLFKIKKILLALLIVASISTVAFLALGNQLHHASTKIKIALCLNVLEHPSLEDFHPDAVTHLANMGAEVVPTLMNALKAPNPQVRLGAAWSLDSIQPKPEVAIPSLIEALEEENKAASFQRSPDVSGEVREKIAFAIGHIGGPKAKAAIPVLRLTLQSKEWRAKFSAAKALQLLGAPLEEVVPIYLEELGNNDPNVRIKAALGLGDLGPQAKSAVPGLIKAFADNRDEAGPYYDVFRSYVASTLGKIGPEAAQAIPVLRGALQDKHEAVRFSASVALKKIESARS